MDAARVRLEPVDARFFARAPLRYVGTCETPRPADEVWGELTRDGTLEWCRALSPVKWTSGRPFGGLSERELTVLRALTGSLSERDIAREFYLSHSTIHTHTKSIYRKLGVSSRAQAVRQERELGLI